MNTQAYHTSCNQSMNCKYLCLEIYNEWFVRCERWRIRSIGWPYMDYAHIYIMNAYFKI